MTRKITDPTPARILGLFALIIGLIERTNPVLFPETQFAWWVLVIVGILLILKGKFS